MLGYFRGALGAVTVVCVTAAVAEPSAAKVPPLKLTKVAAVAPSPGLLDVTVHVRAPKRTAGPAKLRLMLSTDRRLDGRDVRFGTLRTRRTKRGKSSAARLRRTVPAGVTGRRFVLACLGRRSCVASRRALTLAAAPVTPPASFEPPFTPPVTPAPGPAPAATPSPGPTPSSPPPPQKDMTPLPAEIVADVSSLGAAATLAEQAAAAREILTSAGIGFSGTATPAGETPPSGIVLTPVQVLMAARDGHLRATARRTTLAELADQLVQAGMPFAAQRADGTITAPGAALRDFLADASRTALEHPEDPDGRPVLLLAALARAQQRPIDVTVPDYDPADLHLGHLDLLLLTAQVTHLAHVLRSEQSPPPSAAPRRAAATPCSDAQKLLEDGMVFGGDSFAYLSGKAVGETLSTLYQRWLKSQGAGEEGLELGGKRLEKTLAALNILAKLQMLAMLYGHAQATVVPEFEKIDKPEQSTRIIKYHVIAGVPDADWEAYKAQLVDDPLFDAMKDCAALAGLPVPTSLAEIGDAVKNWRVKFRITEGLGFHGLAANQIYLYPGQLEKAIVARDDHSGEQDFFVEVQKADDPLNGGGLILEEPLTVEASVETDPPPKVGLFISAIESEANPIALSGPIADLAAGMFQNLKTIKGSGTTMVRFAEPGEWYGRLVQSTRNHLGLRSFSESESGSGATYQRSTRRIEETDVWEKRTEVHIGSPLSERSGRVGISGHTTDLHAHRKVQRDDLYLGYSDTCAHSHSTHVWADENIKRTTASADQQAPTLSGDGGTLTSLTAQVSGPGTQHWRLRDEHDHVNGPGCQPSSNGGGSDEAITTAGPIGADVADPVAGFVNPNGTRRFVGTVETQTMGAPSAGTTGGVETTRTHFDVTRK